MEGQSRRDFCRKGLAILLASTLSCNSTNKKQDVLSNPPIKIKTIESHVEETAYKYGAAVESIDSFYDENIKPLHEKIKVFDYSVEAATCSPIYNDEHGRTILISVAHLIRDIPTGRSVDVHPIQDYRRKKEYTGKILLSLPITNQNDLIEKFEYAELLMNDQENDVLLARTINNLNLPLCNDWYFEYKPAIDSEVIIAGYPESSGKAVSVKGKTAVPNIPIIDPKGTSDYITIECNGAVIDGFSGSIVHANIPGLGYKACGIVRFREPTKTHQAVAIPSYRIKKSLIDHGFEYLINPMLGR